MKKLSVLFLSFVALATTVTSCSKDDNPAPAPTTLELTIKNNLGTAVSGAEVKLYEDAKQTILAASGTSDDSGKVTFNKDLKAIVYYIDAVAGCQSNFFTADYKTSALVANQTTKMDVKLGATGTVNIMNTSTADKYQLSVTFEGGQEQVLGVVAAGGGGPLTLPTGVNVELKAVKVINNQLSTEPADTIKKTVNIENCGDEVDFNFPS